jgi:hypothetical protein
MELVTGRLAQREDATNTRELAYVRRQLAEINEQLELAELPTVDEPDGTGEQPTVVAIAQDGIARLQRLAAHAWYWHQRLPEPIGPDESPIDDHVRWYHESDGELWGGVLGQYIARGNMRRRRFDHLILHDASTGFYVPVEFDRVLKLRPVARQLEPSLGEAPVTAEMPTTVGQSSIGSCVALIDELDRLRDAIRSSEESIEARDTETLDALQAAARASLDRGAILFLL